MEEVNILSGGVEVLYGMRDSLLELEGYKSKSKELAEKEEQLEKEIAAKEKSIEEEIDTVIKKRKQEIETSFEEQITKTRARVKKVKAKKEKLKDAKVSERIKIETSELAQEKRGLKDELKSVFRLNHISSIFNNNFYYALFMPRTLKDICVILITIVLVLLVIPLGIYKLFLPAGNWYLVIDYVITVVLFGGLYLCIGHATKEKHQEAANKIRNIRKQILIKEKKIKAATKSIRKDKDESNYGLEKFNSELSDLEREVEVITEEKKKALSVFESSAKSVIIDEIRGRSQDELQRLRSEHDTAYEEQKEAEENIKQYSIQIANKYETYIGKHNMSLATIDKLVDVMQEGTCNTVSEALTAIKMSQQHSN